MKKSLIKKDDLIEVISGRNKKSRGRVVSIDLKKEKVIIQGVNMVKKAMKPKKQNDSGGIVDIEAPVHFSNVLLVCKKCGPVRVGVSGSGKAKTRVCKKCGEEIK